MKRSQAKEETRKRLVRAARGVFIKSDFKATTLEISREARIAHGTLFFYFKNREELVLEVVRDLVREMTDALYARYTGSNGLAEFLEAHFGAVRANWPLLRALYAGFSKFNDRTRQEVVSLLAVVNYYLVEAFNKWADNGLSRTMLWQGTLVYLTIFGDYMFDQDRMSDKFIENLISFISAAPVAAGEAGAESGGRKKHCVSCGMIFRTLNDYPMGDSGSAYCRYCAGEDGKLGSFDEVLGAMTVFFQRALGLNPKAARKSALTALSKNPAWQKSPALEKAGDLKTRR